MTTHDRDSSRETDGPFAYQGLDRVLHEKARLGILTALATRTDGTSFVDLKRLCSLTDGNLARHLQTLVDAGLVRIDKDREDGRPVTRAHLTEEGRTQFVAYLEELERVIRDARSADFAARNRSRPDPDDEGFATA
jgi:DNA-binding MarR family transcriptional regulator